MSQSNGPDLVTLLGFGLTIAAVLVLGLALGWLADVASGTFPVFTLVGLTLGIIGAAAHMYVQFKKYLKE